MQDHEHESETQKDTIQLVNDLKLVIRVYGRFHTGDSEEFAKGYIQALKDTIKTIKDYK